MNVLEAKGVRQGGHGQRPVLYGPIVNAEAGPLHALPEVEGGGVG
jgi:hypothetical protein